MFCWLLLILFLFASAPFNADTSLRGGSNQQNALCNAETIRSSSSQLPEWTVMVYMDADNNLNQFGINDINEMEAVGSTANLSIIVLFDGNGYGDSKIYKIDKDQDGYNATIVSTVVDDGGKVISNSTKEANMVDPNTLLSFGKFVFDNYPAQHYLLSIWDHGEKLFGASYGSDGHDVNGNSIPYYTNGLSMIQIDEVLKNLTKYIDRKIDIVGFDACYLGFVETCYQFSQYADYFIGAEDVEPDNGWNYTFLSAIANNSLVEPAELAKEAVIAYDNEYRSTFSYEKFSDNYTLAAVDLYSLMNFFIPLLDNFSSELQKYMHAYQTELRNLRNVTETYNNGPHWSGNTYNADLYHFVELVATDTTLPESLRNSAMCLTENYSKVIIANSNSSYDKNAHGISIYFPKDTYDEEYDTFKFANETWDEFILMYLNPRDITKPAIVHDPLSRRQTIHPCNITAVITDEELNTDGVFAWYSTDGSNYSNIPMNSTSIADTYYAVIPAQPDNTTVYYYIEAIDKNQNVATSPEDASASNTSSVYIFQVVVDVLPPTIIHTALNNVSENSDFYPIAANITDDFSVDKNNISVYWKLNESAEYTKARMTGYNESEFLYKIPKQNVGSAINYYIEARDTASEPNIQRFPTTGNFTFHIVPTAPSVLNASIRYKITINESYVVYTAETSLSTYSNLKYIWTFDDENFGFGKIINHTYPRLGEHTTSLSVMDDCGNAFGAAVAIFISKTPVLNFPSTILAEENELLLFNATNSIDSDGTIVNWTWDFGDGTISYGPVVNHTYLVWGTYQMSLTVTDNYGAGNSSNAAVTVNKKPIPRITGPQKASVGETASFSANTSYDIDGTIAHWLWDFGDGNYSYDVFSSHRYSKSGTYYVNLTVWDNNNAHNTTFTTIFVNNPPQASIISPNLPEEKKSVTFDGSNSTDESGNIVNWTWTFGDGSIGYGSTTTHTYSEAGMYYVSLIVTDDAGGRDRANKTIIVRKSTTEGVEGTVGEKTYIYSGVDNQNAVIIYRWDFGDGNITDWSNNNYASHIYLKGGTYTARFQTTYNNVTSEWVDITVVVKNLQPNAKINAVKQAKAGDSILFDASESSGRYASIISYYWNFDDGGYGTGTWTNHTYSKAGAYTVNLTVTDDNGMQNSTTFVIQIDRGENVNVAIPGFDISSVAIAAFIILLSLQIVRNRRRKR